MESIFSFSSIVFSFFYNFLISSITFKAIETWAKYKSFKSGATTATIHIILNLVIVFITAHPA